MILCKLKKVLNNLQFLTDSITEIFFSFTYSLVWSKSWCALGSSYKLLREDEKCLKSYILLGKNSESSLWKLFSFSENSIYLFWQNILGKPLLLEKIFQYFLGR